MKKITFLLAVFMMTVSYGQTSLPIDYEDGTTTVGFEFDGVSSSNIANPDQGTANPSSRVLQVNKPETAAWFSGFGYGVAGQTMIDLSSGSEFTIKIWSNKSGINVRMRLQNSTNDSPAYNVNVPLNTDSEWVELTFDFSSQVTGNETYAEVVIQPDIDEGTETIVGDGVYYIDDIIQVGAPAPTCDDGIQNGDEEGVDCGGSCPDACTTSGPTEDAPVPTDNASDVAAIYSDNYQVLGFETPFGDRTIVDIEGNGNEAMEVVLGFFGNGYGNVDVTLGGTVTDGVLVFDYYTDDSTQFNVFTISPGPVEASYKVGVDEPVVTGQWTRVEVPYSHFTSGSNGGAVDLTDVFQWKVDGNGTVYLDNIYYRASGLGDALSNGQFSINDFRVSPNPTNTIWNLTSKTVVSEVQVFDILGKNVLTVRPNALNAEIDASNLNSGLYLARISSAQGTTTVKLIKN